MTPKEKANELYKKYEFVYIQNYTSKHEVIECIKILIDELIKQLEEIHKPEYTSFHHNEEVVQGYDIMSWWEEVKKELETL